jgi:hypothetical protein
MNKLLEMKLNVVILSVNCTLTNKITHGAVCYAQATLVFVPSAERHTETKTRGTRSVQNFLFWQVKRWRRHNIVTALRNTEVQFFSREHKKIFQFLKNTRRKPHIIFSFSNSFDRTHFLLQRFSESLEQVVEFTEWRITVTRSNPLQQKSRKMDKSLKPNDTGTLQSNVYTALQLAEQHVSETS